MSKSPEPFYFYNSKIQYLRLITKTQYKQTCKLIRHQVVNTHMVRVDYKSFNCQKLIENEFSRTLLIKRCVNNLKTLKYATKTLKIGGFKEIRKVKLPNLLNRNYYQITTI